MSNVLKNTFPMERQNEKHQNEKRKHQNAALFPSNFTHYYAIRKDSVSYMSFDVDVVYAIWKGKAKGYWGLTLHGFSRGSRSPLRD